MGVLDWDYVGCGDADCCYVCDGGIS